MQNRTRTLLRLALAGTSLLTLATMASAQDQAATADSGATVLEEVVVNGGSGGVITADGYVGKSSATVMGLGDREGMRAAVSSPERFKAFKAYAESGGKLGLM